MKSLIAFALAAALAGCGTTAGIGQSPQQVVFAAKSGYAAALTGAVAYRNLPQCNIPAVLPCRDAAILAQVQKADNVANAALDAAENAVRTPQVATSARDKAIQAAQTALAALTAIVASLGVSK